MKTFRVFLKSGNHFDIEADSFSYKINSQTEFISYSITGNKVGVNIVVTQIEAILEVGKS